MLLKGRMAAYTTTQLSVSSQYDSGKVLTSDRRICSLDDEEEEEGSADDDDDEEEEEEALGPPRGMTPLSLSLEDIDSGEWSESLSRCVSGVLSMALSRACLAARRSTTMSAM